MAEQQTQTFEVGDPVLYVPRHAGNNTDHPDCERGVVTTVLVNGSGNQLVWARFKGPTGESVPVGLLRKL